MIEAIRHCLFSGIINVMLVIYMLSKILNVKINFRSAKLYIIYILLVVLSVLNFIYVDSLVRFLVSTIYTIICAKILFFDETHKTITATILEQSILFISELILMLSVIVVFKTDDIVIFNEIYGNYLPNIIICVIAMILINIKPVLKLCNKIISYMEKIKKKNKYILAFIFIITLNVLLLFIYLNSQNIIMVTMNVMFIIIYSYIVYLLLNEKNQNIKYQEENKLLLENLNEYEKMLDYQRVNNHENKNQLLVIKSMTNKNNKKLHAYIDEVIKEKREDNEALYTKAKNIPSGGLQGLVYQKMLLMQEHSINMQLDVSKEIRKIELSKLDAKTNYDICRIIGVIIDNSIEEVIKLKEKEISISMYKDENEFIIEVANKCKEVPNLEKIDNKGYTTKETGHGYGLSLLKEICEKNNNIINERKIVGNIFIQIIKIKI